MSAEIEFFAALHTDRLIRKVARRFGDQVRLLQAPRNSGWLRPSAAGPIVYFREINSEPGDAADWLLSGIGFGVALGRPGCLPIPPGVVALLQADSPDELVSEMSRVIIQLQQAADQHIYRAALVGKDRVEVTFLDGEVFDLPTDDEHDWSELRMEPELLYLMVPRDDGRIDTIPWDAIRRPASHVDAGLRSRRQIATALRGLRDETGLSQADAAERSGLTRQTINRLEKGEHHPTVNTLELLAAAYSVTVDELLRRFHTSHLRQPA
jgi:putative transcriptional regulator